MDERATKTPRWARPWDDLISPEEVAIYRNAGFLREVELGRRPAVLVIDAQYNFTGSEAAPVAEAVKQYRFSCGKYAWESIPHIAELLGFARGKGIPVIYTRDMEKFPDPTSAEAANGNDIISEAAPQEGDAVIEKGAYSGFFLTRLLPYLISLSVDTLIVCGGTTSGCVRATVTDAFDYRFRTFVVQECVFDRAVLPHKMNLFDIAGKAAQVVALDELKEMLDGQSFHDAFHATGDSPTWRYVTS